MLKSRRPLKEINASSMADIAFLLLVFFLVTTTMETDFGLKRILPPDIETNPPPIPKRNIMEVFVNAQNEILLEKDLMELSELRAFAVAFIANKENRLDWPNKKTKEIDYFGAIPVSKQVISLQNTRGTNYATYVGIQNELAAAYRILRNEIAREKFGQTYDELIEKGEKKKVEAIREIYPQRISEAEINDTTLDT